MKTQIKNRKGTTIAQNRKRLAQMILRTALGKKYSEMFYRRRMLLYAIIGILLCAIISVPLAPMISKLFVADKDNKDKPPPPKNLPAQGFEVYKCFIFWVVVMIVGFFLVNIVTRFWIKVVIAIVYLGTVLSIGFLLNCLPTLITDWSVCGILGLVLTTVTTLFSLFPDKLPFKAKLAFFAFQSMIVMWIFLYCTPSIPPPLGLPPGPPEPDKPKRPFTPQDLWSLSSLLPIVPLISELKKYQEQEKLKEEAKIEIVNDVEVEKALQAERTKVENKMQKATEELSDAQKAQLQSVIEEQRAVVTAKENQTLTRQIIDELKGKKPTLGQKVLKKVRYPKKKAFLKTVVVTLIGALALEKKPLKIPSFEDIKQYQPDVSFSGPGDSPPVFDDSDKLNLAKKIHQSYINLLDLNTLEGTTIQTDLEGIIRTGYDFFPRIEVGGEFAEIEKRVHAAQQARVFKEILTRVAGTYIFNHFTKNKRLNLNTAVLLPLSTPFDAVIHKLGELFLKAPELFFITNDEITKLKKDILQSRRALITQTVRASIARPATDEIIKNSNIIIKKVQNVLRGKNFMGNEEKITKRLQDELPTASQRPGFLQPAIPAA